MTKIAVILGSATPPGRLHSAVLGASERAQPQGVTAVNIDLAQQRLDFVDGRPAEQHDDDSARVIAAVTDAQAVILATPIYRATYTGALKNLLDWLPVEALQGKPVGIVSMGATSHHYLGADSQLREVLAWFGALVAPTSVYLSSADFVDGKPQAAAEQALDELFGTIVLLATTLGDLALRPVPLASARGS